MLVGYVGYEEMVERAIMKYKETTRRRIEHYKISLERTGMRRDLIDQYVAAYVDSQEYAIHRYEEAMRYPKEAQRRMFDMMQQQAAAARSSRMIQEQAKM